MEQAGTGSVPRFVPRFKRQNQLQTAVALAVTLYGQAESALYILHALSTAGFELSTKRIFNNMQVSG